MLLLLILGFMGLELEGLLMSDWFMVSLFFEEGFNFAADEASQGIVSFMRDDWMLELGFIEAVWMWESGILRRI